MMCILVIGSVPRLLYLAACNDTNARPSLAAIVRNRLLLDVCHARTQDLQTFAASPAGMGLFAAKLMQQQLHLACNALQQLAYDRYQLNCDKQQRPSSSAQTGAAADTQRAAYVTGLYARLSSKLDLPPECVAPLQQPACATSAPCNVVWQEGPLQGLVWPLDMSVTRVIDGMLLAFRE